MEDNHFKISLFGLFLIVFGSLFMLKNFGVLTGDMFEQAWPVILIVLGFGIFVKKNQGACCTPKIGKKK